MLGYMLTFFIIKTLIFVANLLHAFFFLEFQLMASAPDERSWSLDQDTNQFLV